MKPPNAIAPVPMLDLHAQYDAIHADLHAAIGRVVASQNFILGEEVKAFEAEMAKVIGVPHAIGCASGSDALLLALMALELNPGDEVITTPYTFFATVSAIVRLGLRPVLCDIDLASFNIDPVQIEPLVTSRTRAILPVHLFGRCASMDPILALARARDLTVIEDVAQALGAADGGRMAGAMGTIGCFSFFPAKILGAFGDGGLVTAKDGELADRLRMLRVHGSARKYLHERVGINSRLDSLQAAILRAKLPYLIAWIDARQAAAQRYAQLFEQAGLLNPSVDEPPIGRVVVPEIPAGRHAFNYYAVRVAAAARDGLIERLKAEAIGCAVYYPLPLHLQPCFRDLGYREGDLPRSEAASHQSLALPIYPELTGDQQERVVGVIADFFKQTAPARVRKERRASK